MAGAVLRASRKGCGAPGRRWPAAPICVAGAVLRASRKGCGAPGRRSEPLERVAARLVAAGPRLLSAWQAQYLDLQNGLRRAWSPLAWQAQYLGPPEGVAARLVAAGSRLVSAWQAQYLEPPQRVAARLVAAGPRFLSAWQAQYLEPPEGVASSGAPGRRRAAAPVCVAGAILGSILAYV